VLTVNEWWFEMCWCVDVWQLCWCLGKKTKHIYLILRANFGFWLEKYRSNFDIVFDALSKNTIFMSSTHPGITLPRTPFPLPLGGLNTHQQGIQLGPQRWMCVSLRMPHQPTYWFVLAVHRMRCHNTCARLFMRKCRKRSAGCEKTLPETSTAPPLATIKFVDIIRCRWYIANHALFDVWSERRE